MSSAVYCFAIYKHTLAHLEKVILLHNTHMML